MNKSEQSEKTVREYFEARTNWTVKKLDFGKEKAADFRICDGATCFLCEVKTIGSVRANFPSTPLDSFLVKRESWQDEIKKWAIQNPERQLFLRSDERDFVYGDKIAFSNKYRKRLRNTEDGFKKFAQIMKDHFSKSAIKDLSYFLRLDSDDLEPIRKIFEKRDVT